MSDPRKRLRSMALVCLLLGPLLILMALFTHGALRLYDHILAQDVEVETFGVWSELLFGFARRSFVWMMGLGVSFTITGFIGRSGGQRGRRALVVAGWFGSAGMVALTVVWVLEVQRLGMHFAWTVLGVAVHGVQLVAMIRGLVYLMGPRGIAAADGRDVPLPAE